MFVEEYTYVLGRVHMCFWNGTQQFWSTAVAKSINGEAQIHASVDGKKVIISEASIRRDLQFAYKEGVNCLQNSTIFEQLATMGV
uniref:Uncharacterized protein n=1 Tax=Tanacetum cinerariifolium TaxID=118510 RepID=A0A699H876_TANCI|nr:hypothetical protein [Tanacetum cinerariifolium]